jgi:non-ribosomal peptide synthetase-like protein
MLGLVTSDPLGSPGPRRDCVLTAPRRLHDFFEQQVDATPAACALVCGTERLSYAELDARANRMAHYLARQGVRAGDRVGLLFERSVDCYAALLAVLKCGAAYVPIDATFPSDRVAFIAEDAGLAVLLTTTAFREAVAVVTCRTLALDAIAPAVAAESDTRLTAADAGDALCYINYTSGTTGRPKGVVINHSSICNLIEVCLPIYGVTAADRVYQGMTFAFDFSIEEVWHTFATGATLIAGPNDHRRLGPGLADFLDEHKISVLCCTPTLLAALERDVPTLRTLILGGEGCPPDVVRRRSRPGLRILNTYGLTETTVTCTWTEMHPDRLVTIGKPLPTYTVHILDEAQRPLPAGEVGEIYVGGIGIADGYVNRPELTRERFLPDPFTTDRPNARLYKTGDLGRFTPEGEVECLGRIDSQVKIRGYRIETAEIEAVLMESAAVNNALVVPVKKDGTVCDLAAYVTLRGPAADPLALKRQLHTTLSQRLPRCAVPAYLEILDAFPTLPSGKADRSRLPAPTLAMAAEADGDAAPATPLERAMAAGFGEVLGREVSAEAHFFYDLGGHSMAAAQVISRLRREPQMDHLGVGDLYAHPTVRSLAKYVEARQAASASATPAASRQADRLRHSAARIWTCGVAQFALGLVMAVLLGMPFASWFVGWNTQNLWTLFLCAAFTGVALMPLSLLMPFALKWLLIGRFRPGRYPLWGWYYFRFWVVARSLAMVPFGSLAGTPLAAFFARLLGARIGRGCHLGSTNINLPDLIEIGDGASIGFGADLRPFVVEDGWLHLAPIKVGAGAFVGTNSVVMPGGSVGDGARLLEQSLVPCAQAIPAGETWAGSPAQCLAKADPQLEAMEQEKVPERWTPGLVVAFAAAWYLLGWVPVLVIAPGLLLIYLVSGGELLPGLLLAPVAGLMWVLMTCLVTWVGRRLTRPNVGPGLYPLRSWFGLRKWLADRFMTGSLGATHSLYGTLYAPVWLRLLGAKVGRRAEVTTVGHIDPDHLTLGAESFTADLAVLGGVRTHNGCIALGATEVGARSFVGNSALVRGGTRLAEGSLIGVLSAAPAEVEAGTSWLGSPAIFLPKRQSSGNFSEAVTFRPPARMVACRLAIEYFRVTLPATLGYAFAFAGALAVLRLAALRSTLLLAVALPALYLGMAMLLLGLVVGLKWLIVGRYRPRVEPLWSHFVWRTELITALYESVMAPGFLSAFTGTPFLPPLLRLFGAKIGKRVYLETTYLTEFDLVRIGDDAQVGGATSLQTHLFEDRVMKMSTLSIGAECSVGPRSVILYDTQLEKGARLDGLSLVMKGESLAAETAWRGIPAQPVV